MQPARWNPVAAATLASALGDDAAEIQADVDAGRCELWYYPPNTWLVTRIERTHTSLELVLVAGAGEDGHAVIRQWLALARRIQCRAVRVHSSRPGMGRYLAPLGFRPVETVYRASL